MITLAFMAASCFKEDERVTPYPGSIIAITDSVQKHQNYFDLESGLVVATHRNDEWQIGFESSKTGWHIITNSGNSWFLYNTEQQTTDNLPEMPQELKGLYDVHSAWPDSTAAGNWLTFDDESKSYSRNVYLLGKYSNGQYMEKKQLVFLEVSDSSYSFFYKDHLGNEDTVYIEKDTTVNFVYYSFDAHNQVNLEPAKSTYDVIFTSYYDIATNFNITMPYLVGGGLLNTWNTTGALDSINSYEGINIETMAVTPLTAKRDIPGYRWKMVTVDVSGGGAATYEVKTSYNYLFRTAQGNAYKLRFVSYSIDGRSGHPQFEYRLLE
jgi:hypothetical protein